MAGISNGVDVAGTDAFLIIRKAVSCRMGLAQQVRNEWMHTGGSKKHGRVVVGDKGLALNLGMPLRLEEFNIFRA
jgi:hypothetical protein